MPLSEYERKMLDELEAQLADEDPTFADTLKPEQTSESVSRQFSIRHLVLGLLVLVAGIAVLVAGVALEQVLIGVLGVVVMFGGAWYITEGIVERPVDPASAASKPSPKPKSGRGFMARQAEEWEKRRRERG